MNVRKNQPPETALAVLDRQYKDATAAEKLLNGLRKDAYPDLVDRKRLDVICEEVRLLKKRVAGRRTAARKKLKALKNG